MCLHKTVQEFEMECVYVCVCVCMHINTWREKKNTWRERDREILSCGLMWIQRLTSSNFAEWVNRLRPKEEAMLQLKPKGTISSSLGKADLDFIETFN